MTIPTISTNPRRGRRRLGLATAGVAALGGGTLVMFGSAGAGWAPCDPNDPGPIVELCETPDLVLPPDLDLDDLAPGPTITLPPNLSIPNLTIPNLGSDDDSPTITLPPNLSIPNLTIPNLGDGDADDQPAEPPTDTAAPVDPPSGTTTPPAVDGPSQQVETPGQAGLLLPAVRISEAAVTCDGSVRVVYETDADPALSAEAEHLVTVSPLVVPDVALARRLVQQPLNGEFVAELATPVDDYRVFVLVDFEPANPDGALLADEATITAPADCPAG